MRKSLYDLLKNALRQRPDYIIVGEVRGAEAYTLSQAIATGHGGLATIHGDSIEAAIRRLESEPMNVPRPLITALDILTVQAKVKISNKISRKTLSVHEIVGLDHNTKDLLTNELFRWNPKKDFFIKIGKSYLLDRMQKKLGINYEDIRED